MGQIINTHNLVFKEFLSYPDVTVEEGSVTFISGVSGCGKSTLLKLFNGTATPSTGSVSYRGQDISDLDKIQLRRDVLLVKQVPYLFRGTIADNFQTFHKYHETVCPDLQEIKRYLEQCCLSADPYTECDTMSGGERQRVFLGISLSLLPEVLLLDEPTSSLNKDLSLEVISNVISYAKHQGKTLVIISHDAELQSVYAEKIIELRRSL